MNRILIYLLSLVMVSTIYLGINAVNGQGPGSQSGGNSVNGSGLGQGNSGTQPIQNQNQLQTQNQGEDTMIKVQNQENQGTATGRGSNSAGTANGAGLGRIAGLGDYRSMVAQKLQKFLGSSSAPGGVGEQVRVWARTQQQAENNIQNQLNKVESRSEWAKSMIGPNYGALKSLKQEMEQNQVRVKQLEQLKLQLKNQGEITEVQEMINLMQQENTALQQRIGLEESRNGIFGWLVKLFYQ